MALGSYDATLARDLLRIDRAYESTEWYIWGRAVAISSQRHHTAEPHLRPGGRFIIAGTDVAYFAAAARADAKRLCDAMARALDAPAYRSAFAWKCLLSNICLQATWPRRPPV